MRPNTILERRNQFKLRNQGGYKNNQWTIKPSLSCFLNYYFFCQNEVCSNNHIFSFQLLLTCTAPLATCYINYTAFISYSKNINSGSDIGVISVEMHKRWCPRKGIAWKKISLLSCGYIFCLFDKWIFSIISHALIYVSHECEWC